MTERVGKTAMTNEHRTAVNDFFVNVFNKILLYEEQALGKSGCKDLSVREMHVLEAVEALEAQDRSSMSNVAARLFISVSSLTTSVNVLVRKGYLYRETSQKDRRIIFVKLTEKGAQASEIHRDFHEKMVDSLEQTLDDEEWDTLLRSLKALEVFFSTAGSKDS